MINNNNDSNSIMSEHVRVGQAALASKNCGGSVYLPVGVVLAGHGIFDMRDEVNAGISLDQVLKDFWVFCCHINGFFFNSFDVQLFLNGLHITVKWHRTIFK